MEGSSRIEELLGRAVDDEVAERRAWREAMETFGARLAALEAAVDRLRTDLETGIEQAALSALGAEFDRVSAQLGKRVDDLGRMMVRDLGRLKQVLDGDRALMVEEVRQLIVASDGAGGAVEGSAVDAPPAPEEVDLPAERAGRFRRRG